MESNYFYKVSFYYESDDQGCEGPEEKYFSHNSYNEVKKYFEELRDIDKCELIFLDQVEFGRNGNFVRLATYEV